MRPEAPRNVEKNGQSISDLDTTRLSVSVSYPFAPKYDQPQLAIYSADTGQNDINNQISRDTISLSDSRVVFVPAMASFAATGYAYNPCNYEVNVDKCGEYSHGFYSSSSADPVLFLSIFNPDNHYALGATAQMTINYEDDDGMILASSTPITILLAPPTKYSQNDIEIAYVASGYPFDGSLASTSSYSYSVPTDGNTSGDDTMLDYSFSHDRVAEFQARLKEEPNLQDINISPTFSLAAKNTSLSGALENIKIINETEDEGVALSDLWLFRSFDIDETDCDPTDPDDNFANCGVASISLFSVSDSAFSITPDSNDDYVEMVSFVSYLTDGGTKTQSYAPYYGVYDASYIERGCYNDTCHNISIIATHDKAEEGYFYLATAGVDLEKSQIPIAAELLVDVTDSTGNTSKVYVPIYYRDYYFMPTLEEIDNAITFQPVFNNCASENQYDCQA
ncbi:MAG: hypothetical protein ACO2ZM_07505 [Francisellaceae bacterium]